MLINAWLCNEEDSILGNKNSTISLAPYMYVIFYLLSSVSDRTISLSDLITLSWCNLVCLCFLKYEEIYFLSQTGESTLPFSSLRAMEQLSSIKQGISRLFFIVAFYMNALHKLFYSTLPRKGRHNTALSFFTKGWLKKTSFHIALLLSYLGRLTFVKLRTLLNLSNFFLPLRHFHRVFWRCLPTFSLIGHVRYINIQAWVRGFRIKIANFSSFFCPSIPIRDLIRYKRNNTKYRSLTWKPQSHVRILIYRTWPIGTILL